jgi:hypothetical protein
MAEGQSMTTAEVVATTVIDEGRNRLTTRPLALESRLFRRVWRDHARFEGTSTIAQAVRVLGQ